MIIRMIKGIKGIFTQDSKDEFWKFQILISTDIYTKGKSLNAVSNKQALNWILEAFWSLNLLFLAWKLENFGFSTFDRSLTQFQRFFVYVL